MEQHDITYLPNSIQINKITVPSEQVEYYANIVKQNGTVKNKLQHQNYVTNGYNLTNYGAYGANFIDSSNLNSNLNSNLTNLNGLHDNKLNYSNAIPFTNTNYKFNNATIPANTISNYNFTKYPENVVNGSYNNTSTFNFDFKPHGNDY